jgi:hypothetical protein
MKTYELNQSFTELDKFIVGLPEAFNHLGTIVQNNRNELRKVVTQNGELIVKNFRGMYFFNRLAYSLFRKSKAERSFLHSQILNQNGILTPAHVAWIDRYRWGLLQDSFFVCVYDPHPTLKVFRSNSDAMERADVLRQLATFTYKLHSLGIYHEDFSVGNILVKKVSDSYDFILLDLNRMKFGRRSYRNKLRGFNKLDLPKEDLDILLTEYARLSAMPVPETLDVFWKDKNAASALRKLRRKIRSYTLTPLENLFQRASPR